MKMKRKLLLPLFVLAITFLLSGCVNKPLEDLRLSLALTKKYGEIFIVADSFVSSGNWLNAGPLEAVCYPLSDKKLNFKATYSYKRNQLYGDKYVEAVVREEAYAEMEQILSQYYTDFYLDVRVITPVFQIDELSKYEDFASIEDVSIASYEEKYGEKMDIHYDVAINNNEISDVDEIKQIFQEYTGNFNNAMLIFQCCFVSEDFIEE